MEISIVKMYCIFLHMYIQEFRLYLIENISWNNRNVNCENVIFSPQICEINESPLFLKLNPLAKTNDVGLQS